MGSRKLETARSPWGKPKSGESGAAVPFRPGNRRSRGHCFPSLTYEIATAPTITALTRVMEHGGPVQLTRVRGTAKNTVNAIIERGSSPFFAVLLRFLKK